MINKLNGKLNDLQASVEYSDKVNLKKYKVSDINVSHINENFRKHVENTANHLCETEEKLC